MRRRGGSSPRVRGTPRVDRLHAAIARFIPACAGNAREAARHELGVPVHPRVCGERFDKPCNRSIHFGSSPRVRGTLGRRVQGIRCARFIPACAGNAHPTASRYRRNAVHPRVCGERLSCPVSRLSNGGSSPRVRGTRRIAVIVGTRRRFIPACAGNATANCLSTARNAVHPRVCGEREIRQVQKIGRGGSSPRVRGTPPLVQALNIRIRFIPACAGNAASLPANCFLTSVHPRVCGERRISFVGDNTTRGSSPRVRGTHINGTIGLIQDRFIPACAGNASTVNAEDKRRSVHPRVCGERCAKHKYIARFCGSSPRVRGTLGGGDRKKPIERFIPACAGNA